MSKLNTAVCALTFTVLLASGCATPPASSTPEAANETADQFIARVNKEVVEQSRESEAAYWVCD